MKKILVITCLLLNLQSVQASEISGVISTKFSSNEQKKVIEVNSIEPKYKVKPAIELASVQADLNLEKSLQVYTEGMLIRSSDMRIYVVRGGYIEYIPSLKDLYRYKNQEIFNVGINTIEMYPLRSKIFAEGTLLRQGFEKIFVIKEGRKVHVLNLEILKSEYAGKEIFDVSDSVINQY